MKKGIYICDSQANYKFYEKLSTVAKRELVCIEAQFIS